MGSIGALNFKSLSVAVEPSAEVNVPITSPNADGVAYMRIGKRSPVIRAQTITDLAAFGDDVTVLKSYKALTSGPLVDVVDDLGNTWTAVMVLSVNRSSPTIRLAAVTGGLNISEGGTGFGLFCTWSLQSTVVD